MPPEIDTTQTDVSAEENQPTTDPKIMTDATNPRRGPVLEDIAAKRREQLQEDGWDLEEEGAETTENEAGEGPEPSTRLSLPAKEADADTEPDTSSPAEPAEPTVTVSIDGESREVPASAVRTKVKVNGEEQEIDGVGLTRDYQTMAAGQQRFREANAALQIVQAREREIATWYQSQQAQPPEHAAEQPVPGGGISKEQARELARKMQYGEEDDAAEAIQALSQGGGQAADPGQVAAQAALITEERMSYRGDLESFGEKYPDIVEDPRLVRLAADGVHQLRAQDLQALGYDLTNTTPQEWAHVHRVEQQRGRVRTNRELFQISGQATMDWRSGNGEAAPTEGQPAGFDKKIAAKRKAPTSPRSANMRQPTEPAPEVLTPAQKITRMRQARGQPGGAA